MFMFLFMIDNLLESMVSIFEDILELNAPKIDITKKPPRLGK